ncbi:elongation factor 1-gamma-like [Zonotrichia leucophrys gambelii]|uniref:elongation factor 1-gamma-like n=1 Tax=Zonotrichia leucophrys gambelii TaxID=257770 RepID=UPI0031408309
MPSPPVLLLPPPPGDAAALRVLIAARFRGDPPPVLLQRVTPPGTGTETGTGNPLGTGTGNTLGTGTGTPLGSGTGAPPHPLPALRTPEGALLGPGAAALLLSPPEMRGRDPREAALVRQWVAFAEGELGTAAAILVGGHKQARPRALQELSRGLGALESHLSSGRSFLVGDGVTLADVTVLCALLGPFTQVLDPRSRAPFPGVSRWFLSAPLPSAPGGICSACACPPGTPRPRPCETPP